MNLAVYYTNVTPARFWISFDRYWTDFNNFWSFVKLGPSSRRYAHLEGLLVHFDPPTNTISIIANPKIHFHIPTMRTLRWSFISAMIDMVLVGASKCTKRPSKWAYLRELDLSFIKLHFFWNRFNSGEMRSKTVQVISSCNMLLNSQLSLDLY